MNMIAPITEAVPVDFGLESLDQFVARNKQWLEPPVHSKFGVLYMDQLDAPGPEHEFLVSGWLSKGDRSIIGGASRSGKSFLATEIGLRIAHGQPVFGFPTIKGLVIYQCGEGARGMKKRLRAWRKHHEIAFTRDTPFVLLQRPIDLYQGEDTEKLIEDIRAVAKGYPEIGLALVIIDTLATATPGADENSGKDMSLVMQNMTKINEAIGAHVCLVHHLNAGGVKLRGHTSVYANVDQVIMVHRNAENGIRSVYLDKQKDDEDGSRLQFELLQVHVGGIDTLGNPITSCVCLPVGEKEIVRRDEARKGIKISEKAVRFMRIFFSTVEKFGVPVPKEMNLSSSVRAVVDWKDVLRELKDATPPDESPPEDAIQQEKDKYTKDYRNKLKNEVRRCGEELRGLGVLAFGRNKQIGDRHVAWFTGKPLRAFPETHITEFFPRAESEHDIEF